jgi:hypothetical protein
MLAAFVITLATYAVLVSMRSAWLAAVCAPFLFRTHYRIDEAGIRERRGWVTRTRPWSELRRLEVGTRAALVSPYKQARWLDRYRGMTIYFDGSDRDAVVRQLEAHLAA